MRILRSTVYLSPSPDNTVTTVLREIDCQLGLDEIVADLSRHYPPQAFAITEIFEMDGEPSIEMATMAAASRQRRNSQVEANMAMLYYYDASSLALVTARGVVTATRPAPLTVPEVSEVFRQLAVNPEYKGQTVSTPCQDGTWVSLVRGKVIVGEKPPIFN